MSRNEHEQSIMVIITKNIDNEILDEFEIESEIAEYQTKEETITDCIIEVILQIKDDKEYRVKDIINELINKLNKLKENDNE